jgi:hypothetical protein
MFLCAGTNPHRYNEGMRKNGWGSMKVVRKDGKNYWTPPSM